MARTNLSALTSDTPTANPPRKRRLAAVPVQQTPPPPPLTPKTAKRKPAKPKPEKLSREITSGGLSEMSQALNNLPAEYTVCRESRHHWVPFSARRASNGMYERIRRCDSCGGVKRQLLDSSFRVWQEWPIDYPDNYLITGLGRLTGDDIAVVRGINFLRELDQLNGQ